MRAIFKHRLARGCLLTGVVLAALLLPRLWALRSVELTSDLQFADTLSHLLNLDRLTRTYTLDRSQLSGPFLQKHPGVLQLNNQANWPPGLYHVALPAAATLGTMSIWTTQLTNLLFYGVLLVGVFGLGRVLGGWRVGFWAALLTALCPALVAASWYFTIDFPLVGMAAVGLLLLWYTRYYHSPLYTLLFALWAAAGMLIKFTYAIYLVLPCLWCLYHGLRHGPRRGRMVLHLGLATALVLVLVWLGHGTGFKHALETLTVHLSSEIPDPNPDWTFVPISPWSLKGLVAVAAYTAMNFPLPLVLLALPVPAAPRQGQAGPLSVARPVLGGLRLHDPDRAPPGALHPAHVPGALPGHRLVGANNDLPALAGGGDALDHHGLRGRVVRGPAAHHPLALGRQDLAQHREPGDAGHQAPRRPARKRLPRGVPLRAGGPRCD